MAILIFRLRRLISPPSALSSSAKPTVPVPPAPPPIATEFLPHACAFTPKAVVLTALAIALLPIAVASCSDA